MRDKNNKPVWNIFLKEIRPKHYKIIMPDDLGNLDKDKIEANKSNDGFLISWPLNPNFTGSSTISLILEQTPNFAGCVIDY